MTGFSTVKNFQGNRQMEQGLNCNSGILEDRPGDVNINDTAQDERKQYRMDYIAWHHHPEYPYQPEGASVTGVNFGAGREKHNQYLTVRETPTSQPLQDASGELLEVYERGPEDDKYIFEGMHHSLQLWASEDCEINLPEDKIDRRRLSGGDSMSEAYAALLEPHDKVSGRESDLLETAHNSEESVLRTTSYEQAARLSNHLCSDMGSQGEHSIICGDQAEKDDHLSAEYDLRMIVDSNRQKAEVEDLGGRSGMLGRLPWL